MDRATIATRWFISQIMAILDSTHFPMVAAVEEVMKTCDPGLPMLPQKLA